MESQIEQDEQDELDEQMERIVEPDSWAVRAAEDANSAVYNAVEQKASKVKEANATNWQDPTTRDVVEAVLTWRYAATESARAADQFERWAGDLGVDIVSLDFDAFFRS
jgi:hypothetical protein